MDPFELMRTRHSVRQFLDKPLEAGAVEAIRAEIDACNREGGLHIQLIIDEPEAFRGNKPHYGSFSGCKNYLALAGPGGMDEEIGYYGERVVLACQRAGVNSCWVALTFRKGKAVYELGLGEKLYMVIALGYGKTQGSERKSKTAEQISDITDASPDWYRRGLEAVLLAPTAVNQQKFRFSLKGEKVAAAPGFGVCTKVDLGIAKYHFELGSGKGPEIWA